MAGSKLTQLEQQSVDLSTCCICTNTYNDSDLKPKYLPCHHTFCLRCIKRVAENGVNSLLCPICKKACGLKLSDAENLTTNSYALHIIQLNIKIKNDESLCLKCGQAPKPFCRSSNHSIMDMTIFLQKIKGAILESLVGATSNSNNETPLIIFKPLEPRISSYSNEAPETSAMTRSQAIPSAARSRNIPIPIRSSQQSFRCTNLTFGISSPIYAVELSENAEYLAAGGRDTVLLWSLPDSLSGSYSPEVMQTKHTTGVVGCLAIESGSRIFSGGCDPLILIHDTRSGILQRTVAHRSNNVCGIAIQPGTNDSVFTAACADGHLRIFDLRRNASDPVFVTEKRPGPLYSTMFCATNWMLFAVAGAGDGTQVLDFRRLSNNFLYYFPSPKGTVSARFNNRGSKLLCIDRGRPPVVYDLPSNGNQVKLELDRNTFPPFYRRDPFYSGACFSGSNDDQVAYGLDDPSGIYVWSLPGTERLRQGVQSIDQPLAVLNQNGSRIYSVRHSTLYKTLFSCSEEHVIKMWRPIGRN